MPKQNKKLQLNTAWCKGCGICVEFCPRSVLALEHEKVYIANAEACIACGMCERLCPDYVLYLQEEEA